MHACHGSIFQKLCRDATTNRQKRASELQVESVARDKRARHGADDESYGVRGPDDVYRGDVCVRDLLTLLDRFDANGYERSAQQVEFHAAFTRACGRVLYRDDWGLARPSIMRRNGWVTSPSEILISTPRRFGKTFSVAMYCAAIALAAPCEIVVFSPARRASRKLLERIHEFVVLAGFQYAIREYNMEQLRLCSAGGGDSLVRSFPSKVSVRAHR